MFSAIVSAATVLVLSKAVAENGLFLLLFFKPSFGEDGGENNGEHTLTDI
jgi:hypothetical protein